MWIRGAVFGTLLLCVAASGCGQSAADKAAEEMLAVAKEAKAMETAGSTDPSQAMALLGRMMETASKLEAEMEKMSPEERKAFEEKWEKRFKEEGLGDFDAGSGGNAFEVGPADDMPGADEMPMPDALPLPGDGDAPNEGGPDITDPATGNAADGQ
ncbi:MAG: hypothetical protein KY476_07145 [Planctomycetes bacterium]|nr:hypothetical protein [Planctomycetota bacterium]